MHLRCQPNRTKLKSVDYCCVCNQRADSTFFDGASSPGSLSTKLPKAKRESLELAPSAGDTNYSQKKGLEGTSKTYASVELATTSNFAKLEIVEGG